MNQLIVSDASGLSCPAIVAQLDRWIIGQDNAKRSVAIALRNRWRRMQLDRAEANEIVPNNIIMIGPTGVGKTEIARRLTQIAGLPFVKVEATKFTEKGYVGRDVDSMVRDLVEDGIALLRRRVEEQMRVDIDEAVEEKLIDAVFPPLATGNDPDREQRWQRSRDKIRQQLRDGSLEERDVTIRTSSQSTPIANIFTAAGEQMDASFGDGLSDLFPKKIKDSVMTVSQARRTLRDQELDQRVDPDQLAARAIDLVEQGGIVFIDEIDKIAGGSGGHGPDVSREGVQRDLLPVVEGTTVSTKYGPVKTDHVLFIAAGAFHQSKPSDLIPELQGRFPIRVELDNLEREHYLRILKETDSSLLRQYRSLLAVDGCTIEFTDDAIEAMANIAFELNTTLENIGARRLQTIMAHLLDDLLFEVPSEKLANVTIDRAFVENRLSALAADEDLSRYIL